MDTLFVTVGALHPEPQHGRRGLPSDAISWDFNAARRCSRRDRGCRFYNAAGESELGGSPPSHLRAARAGDAPMRNRCASCGVTRCMSARSGERLPNRDSRVDLDPVAARCFRMPLARIAPSLADSDIARFVSWPGVARTASLRAVRNGSMRTFELGLVRRNPCLRTCRMGVIPQARSSMLRDEAIAAQSVDRRCQRISFLRRRRGALAHHSGARAANREPNGRQLRPRKFREIGLSTTMLK